MKPFVYRCPYRRPLTMPWREALEADTTINLLFASYIGPLSITPRALELELGSKIRFNSASMFG